MKTIKLLPILLFFIAFQVKAQTVSDVDGNTYNTVTIGTQVWMKENLKTTKFKNDTAIPNVTIDASWDSLTSPAYCWYNNDSATYKATYGALYNWYTVNTGKLCPTDWHVPADAEWTILTNYLGGNNIAGGKLKESGIMHWNSPNTGADNSTGFTAIPTGQRVNAGSFYNQIGTFCTMWTSSECLLPNACSMSMDYSSSLVKRTDHETKKSGFSVRCLKDESTSVKSINDFFIDKSIYPNPANERLFIKNDNSSNAQIMIFDLQGKQVVCRQIGSNPIDISSLSKGIYLVKIIDSGNIIMEKLVKE
jgi:uncharacterized protein (TIGR02145 family)